MARRRIDPQRADRAVGRVFVAVPLVLTAPAWPLGPWAVLGAGLLALAAEVLAFRALLDWSDGWS